jgi:hypothetical protein
MERGLSAPDTVDPDNNSIKQRHDDVPPSQIVSPSVNKFISDCIQN